MNIKYFISLLAVVSLVACSDDDSAPSKVPDVDPLSSSSDAAVAPASSADPLLASSSSEMDPVQVPASSADPSVAPASSSAVTDAASATSGPLDLNNVQLYGCELTGLEQFKYGRFEARMKMAAVSGSVSSMFLNYDKSYLKEQEPWNEIDIEVLGKSATSWQSNLITREPDVDKANPNISSEKIHEFGFDATADFHLYGIVWTPEYIAWEIDSVEVRRDVVGQETTLAHDQVAFMTEMQSLRFNLWVSNSPSWTGKFTGEGLPVEQQIDYVRVYTYDENTKEFTFSWQDDFEGTSLDATRWSRGNWEMEKVKYRPSNVKVRDGHASIILDYETTN